MHTFAFRLHCTILVVLILAATAVAVVKPVPQVKKLTDVNPVRIGLGSPAPLLRAEDTCMVYHGGELMYYIYPWVVGDELYKAYQDPAAACPDPYPFGVYEVALGLYVLEPAIVQLSVDVEKAIVTNPSCPYPGDMLTMTPLYEVSLDTGLYIVAIPLDSVLEVTAPYFVGAYFGAEGNPSSTAVLTDAMSVSCVSYNDWGEGYVDLDTIYNEGLKVFPGRITLLSNGFPGGTGEVQPLPSARFIFPADGQFLGNSVDVWVNDASGSEIIDRARFQYNLGGNWIDIGYDYSDDPPLRNGVTSSGSGDGLSLIWNTAGLPEADYQLRTIIIDSLGQADTGTIGVHIDPTPPFPDIIQPTFGQNVCGGTALEVACGDEDIMYMSFDVKNAARNFTLPIPLFNQQLGGDIDGAPEDGNSAADGEYGDYCSGPAAAAMACKYWYTRGYDAILTEGAVVLSDAQLMDRLFAAMRVQDNLGTYDGEFVAGLRDYCLNHSDQFDIKIDRSPAIAALRNWAEDYEYAVMVGLSGNPGLWLTLTGADELADESGQHTFTLADPSLPDFIDLPLKDEAGELWAFYNSMWVEVDIMLGLIPKDWSVTRSALGFDQGGDDGWGTAWDVSSLDEDSVYFVHVNVVDQLGHTGFGSVLVENDCLFSFLPGDVDDNGAVDISDLVYLIYYLHGDGPAPPVGYGVADINCDGFIDLADIIYFYRYIFLGGPDLCP